MADLFDYLTWRGDLSFSQSPLNPVDSLIFSQLSYLPFDGIVSAPGEKGSVSIRYAVNVLKEKLKKIASKKESPFMFKKDPELLDALASSNRFGDCQISGFVNLVDTVREIQFSALCVKTGDGFNFIVFRGTDTNLISWKEDFNMSFVDVIPAQLESVNYLEKMASGIKGHFRVGGHSKGGNLAVYAAAFCRKKIQKRIIDIYSLDAPGFHKKVLSSEGFALIKSKIHSFIPPSSVVGMFFESGCEQRIVKSVNSGIMQHDLYSWEVTHNDLAYADDITSGSRFVDKTVKDWIAGQDKEQREQFLNALYSILVASEVNSSKDIETSWFQAVGRMLKSFGSIDENTKQLINKTLRELFNAARRNITLLKRDSSPRNEE
ncbi:MAG: DUF2974 domain-containing protein [Treponema sp.]|jgi:hypothetical protein|nr:DUF2974 domain-containing protein [Treponema sp.]